MLNISGDVSVAETYYKTPIQISTHSGSASSTVTDYQMYDYNNMCGFIAIAPIPEQMTSVEVSATESS